MKVILFGTGNHAETIYSKIKYHQLGIDIVGFCDNNSDNWGEWLGKRVYAPYELLSVEIDKIIVLSNRYYDEIRDDLIYWHKISEDKIESEYYLLKTLMAAKHWNSEDEEIRGILAYWENHEGTVFNQFVKDEGYHVVEWDYMENMPYILLEDKRIYYPYNMQFEVFEGKKILRNVMQEQQSTSPHLYINNDITINDGDIIVDVGAAEGDFSIRFVEKASKVYLFEGDKRWQKPLRKTFEKFKEKVILVDKFAGKTNRNVSLRLDTAISGEINFLKMDVEGAECEALLGAEKILLNSNAKCSICSYHRMGDETAISDILHTYGYKSSTSDGYMFFYHDINIWSTLDFRRGIVYGRK